MVEDNKDLVEDIEFKEEQKDDLKSAIEAQFEKLRTQSMLLGAQVSCSVILQKIVAFEKQPGKRTLNDHRRLIKDIKHFVEVGVSRKVNPDGTTSQIEDVENDTKLTEENNESNIDTSNA